MTKKVVGVLHFSCARFLEENGVADPARESLRSENGWRTLRESTLKRGRRGGHCESLRSEGEKGEISSKHLAGNDGSQSPSALELV
jgi:hypothetical protein